MYEMIIARLQATNDQLLGEIGDLKKIIKVPRIHYKHIENLGLDDIKNQYEKINKKMEAQKRKEEEAAAAAAAAEEGEPGNETVKPGKGKKDRVGGASVRPVKLKHLQLDASSNPRARGFWGGLAETKLGGERSPSRNNSNKQSGVYSKAAPSPNEGITSRLRLKLDLFKQDSPLSKGFGSTTTKMSSTVMSKFDMSSSHY